MLEIATVKELVGIGGRRAGRDRKTLKRVDDKTKRLLSGSSSSQEKEKEKKRTRLGRKTKKQFLWASKGG